MVLKAKGYRLFLSIFAAFLLVVMALVGPTKAAASYTDVNERYTEAVDYLVKNHITNGFTETEFGTNETIKRVDASILLAKALKLDITSNEKSGFADVPERGEGYIAALREAGIVNGKTETSFAPYDNITRGEMALILARGYQLKATETTALPFEDVAERYQQAISSLLEHKVTLGKTETLFGTYDHLTRGEFALFLYRISKIEQISASTDILQASIKTAGQYDPNYFTTGSWLKLEAAVTAAEGVMTNEKATEADVKQANQNLINSINALELKPLNYQVKNGSDQSKVVFNFSTSLGKNKQLPSVSGTIENSKVVLSDNGTVLTVSSSTGAKTTGDTIVFQLNLGGKDVKVSVTWDGQNWRLSTEPAQLFKKISGGQVIKELEVLDSGLKDGSISVDKLLKNLDLLRLIFLQDSGLMAGDTVKAGNDSYTFFTHKLTAKDIEQGFVDFGMSTEFFNRFNSGASANIIAVVERNESIIGSSVTAIKLPNFPLGKPLIDKSKNPASIFQGKAPIIVDLVTEGLEKIEPNSVLKLTIQHDKTETITKSVTQSDIEKGYVELPFDKSIITSGTITLKSELSYGSATTTGDPVTYEVTEGTFGSLLKIDLLDEGLKNGTIAVNKLLNETNLLRATLLNENLAEGNVVKVAYNNKNLLSHKLTPQDITRGSIDFGISEELLSTLRGGEILNLLGTVEINGKVLSSANAVIKLPAFPLVEPVIDMTKNTVGNLSYILAGKVPLQIDIKANGLEQIKPGYTLTLLMESRNKIEKVNVIITQEDIERGYVEYYFSDSNLLQRLLNGLTSGSTIEIIPVVTDGTISAQGEQVTYTLSKGLLRSLGDLLGGLLGGLLGLLF